MSNGSAVREEVRRTDAVDSAEREEVDAQKAKKKRQVTGMCDARCDCVA